MSCLTKWLTLILTVVAVAAASAAGAADPNDCGNCHDSAEFEEMTAAEVREALADPGIPPHGKFADLSEEAVETLLEALAE